MRIKFEKGMTPERMAETLVKFIRENGIVVGTVNMYIQTHDDEMKPEPFKNTEQDYFICKPSEALKEEYEKDVARIRRNKFKLVKEA